MWRKRHGRRAAPHATLRENQGATEDGFRGRRGQDSTLGREGDNEDWDSHDQRGTSESTAKLI